MPTEPANKSTSIPGELIALPRDDEGPVFAEPWQAQAFGMVVTLVEAGHCKWAEWADLLGEELEAAARAGKPDDGSHYYHHWVAALEKLLAQKNLAEVTELDRRKEDWKDAYMRTPHGEPVELENNMIQASGEKS